MAKCHHDAPKIVRRERVRRTAAEMDRGDAAALGDRAGQDLPPDQFDLGDQIVGEGGDGLQARGDLGVAAAIPAHLAAERHMNVDRDRCAERQRRQPSGIGRLVDAGMETSVPGIFAAGDVAEAPDLFTGAHLVAAIQPNAADQARVAATNMARGDGGQATRLNGVLAINVLDTLGLISSSFGQWWGEQPEAGGAGVELVDDARYRYLSLQFRDDVLIGATAIGLTEHVGVLRGLIHGKVRLGAWKDRLLAAPLQFVDAYVARSQQPMALAR